jgi:hypothetical protein
MQEILASAPDAALIRGRSSIVDPFGEVLSQPVEFQLILNDTSLNEAAT